MKQLISLKPDLPCRDRINYVMLNVDNLKWKVELDEFGVEGITHFEFLDKKGNEEGNIVGRLPPTFFAGECDGYGEGDAMVPALEDCWHIFVT